MNNGGYNLYGLSIWARTAGLEVPGFDGVALGPEDVYVYRVGVEAAKRPPCLLSSGSIGGLGDGTGIYMVKGPPKKGKPVYCPPERLKTA